MADLISGIRLCITTGIDCDGVKCPGCILADGGIWNGRKWTYPENTPPEVEARRQRRAIADCAKYGHPDTGKPTCSLCGTFIQQIPHC